MSAWDLHHWHFPDYMYVVVRFSPVTSIYLATTGNVSLFLDASS